MTLGPSFPPLFREALAAHEIFMAAGVSPEDIFVVPGAVSPDGALGQLGVQVKQGALVFTVTVGPLGAIEKDFWTLWPRAARGWNDLSPDARRRSVEGAEIRGRVVEILAAMVLKGFRREAS